MARSRSDALVDRVARAMAENAGVRWYRLDHYAGQQRDRWRDQARALLKDAGRRSLSRRAATAAASPRPLA